MSELDLWNLAEQDEDTLEGKYLFFSLGNQRYGLEIRCVSEIIGMQPITEVPEMPDYVKGVTNLRGAIVPIVDARVRFRKPERAYDERTCIVVVDAGGLTIGLVVDSVAEVAALSEEELVPPPDLSRGGRKYVKGIAKSGDRVQLILDCAELLSEDEIEVLNAMD